MRPTSKIVFVKRSDWFRDSVPNYPMTPKISYTATKQVQVRQEDYFHEQISVLLLLLRLLGAFPVRMSPTDVPVFQLFSPVMAYSILVVLFIGGPTFVAARDYLLQMEGENFSDNVFTILFVAILVTIVYMPVLSWFDVKTTINYLRQWTRFQRMFLGVTNKRINLNLRRKSQVFTGICTIMNCLSILLHFYYPYIELWKVPLNIISGVAVCAAIILKWANFRALINAATNFNSCFKRDLEDKGPTSEMIAKYRNLWLQWSQLVTEEGGVLGTMYVAFLLTMLFILILSLYSTLDKLISGNMGIFFMMNAMVPCAMCAFTLFALCNFGYQLHVLGLQVRTDLQLISPIYSTHQVMLEVKAFLHVIAMNPPLPSIMGFANMDRALFSSLLSATVTYMIVLLQFENGEKNSKETTSTGTSSPVP